MPKNIVNGKEYDTEQICQADIWAIQGDPNEANTALDVIGEIDPTDSKPAVLYKDCESHIRLGGEELQTHFDVAYVAKNRDTVIFLMQGGEMTAAKFEQLLLDRGEYFDTYTSLNPNWKKDCGRAEQELWTARDVEVLNAALEDSVGKQETTCDYYPELEGSIEVEPYGVDTLAIVIPIKGLLRFYAFDGSIEKDVLLLNQGLDMNVTRADVLNALAENGIIPRVVEGSKLPTPEKEKVNMKGNH